MFKWTAKENFTETANFLLDINRDFLVVLKGIWCTNKYERICVYYLQFCDVLTFAKRTNRYLGYINPLKVRNILCCLAYFRPLKLWCSYRLFWLFTSIYSETSLLRLHLVSGYNRVLKNYRSGRKPSLYQYLLIFSKYLLTSFVRDLIYV